MGTCICILIVQYIVTPLLSFCNISLKPIRKLWLSNAFGIMSMIAAILLEHARIAAPVLRDASGKPALTASGVPIHDIHLWWIEIQYFFVGFGEALAFVAAIEFYYNEAPMSLKATAQGINQF